MDNRIGQRFAHLANTRQTALIPFVTAGDPHPEWTVEMLHALVAAGADLLELGVPFSDPMADGPVIQAASERAIENGVSLVQVLEMVAEFRLRDTTTPILLMGYLNPLERMGYVKFAKRASAAGVDAVLLVDAPPEVSDEWRDVFAQAGLQQIFLAAPTTHRKRLKLLADHAQGFLYYVSLKGVTGANRLDPGALEQQLAKVRELIDLPTAVGFGIKTAEDAAAVSKFADAVVIGSALVEVISTAGSVKEACESATNYLAPIRARLDNAVQ